MLPHKVIGGQSATLAVLDAEGQLVPDALVELGGEEISTDATGRAIFTPPETAGVLVARLPGGKSQASTLVALPKDRAPDGVQVEEAPQFVALGDRFSVRGSGFRGEADANRAIVGQHPALVLAASPVALVIAPHPRVSAGPTDLVIEVDGRSQGPVPVTMVALEIEAPGTSIARKKKSKIAVRARGTQQRLQIDVSNLTPEIINLAGGNPQRVRTTGGDNNLATLEIQGRREGEFSLSARLVPFASGLPNIELARQELIVARNLAPVDSVERVDRMVRRLSERPENVVRVRNELERILATAPEGEFGRRLEAAWRILMRM